MVNYMNNKQKIIIGVMGGSHASNEDIDAAYRLGKLIASHEWILLNGGRACGIMEASAKGAVESGGTTVGILPDTDYDQASKYISIPIVTGLGNARNCINVLSSHYIVACPGGAGTLSEIALAIKNKKPLILLNFDTGGLFKKFADQHLLFSASTPEQVIEIIKDLIKKKLS